MKKKPINRIAIYNILSTVALQGIALFTSPVFSRLLGTTNYGIVSVYNTWVSLISVIFGLQTQSTLAVARSEYPEIEQRTYQSSVLTLSIISYCAFSIAMIIWIEPFSKLMGMDKRMYLLMLAHGFGQFCVSFINIKFTYEYDAGKNLVLSLATSLTSVILSMILIYIMPSETNYWGRILGISITYIVLGGVLAAYILYSGKAFYVKKYWSFCIPLALPIIFHNISGLILNQSDRVMLQYSTSYSFVGIYSLAYSFGSIISTIWSALNNSWVPFYYDFTKISKIDEAKKHAVYYAELFTVLSMGFLLLTPEVYHIFVSQDYWDGTRLIPIFVMGFYMIFLYSFLVNYEFYTKNTKSIALATSIAAIVNIVLNYFLIKQNGMFGAAIATFVSYILQYVFHCLCVKRIEKKNTIKYQYSFRMFVPYIVVFYTTAIGCYHLGTRGAVFRWGGGIIIGLFELYRIKKRKGIF